MGWAAHAAYEFVFCKARHLACSEAGPRVSREHRAKRGEDVVAGGRVAAQGA